jgi:hypothetical protein
MAFAPLVANWILFFLGVGFVYGYYLTLKDKAKPTERLTHIAFLLLGIVLMCVAFLIVAKYLFDYDPTA